VYIYVSFVYMLVSCVYILVSFVCIILGTGSRSPLFVLFCVSVGLFFAYIGFICKHVCLFGVCHPRVTESISPLCVYASLLRTYWWVSFVYIYVSFLCIIFGATGSRCLWCTNDIRDVDVSFVYL